MKVFPRGWIKISLVRRLSYHSGNAYCGSRFTGSTLGLNSNGSYDALLAKFDGDLNPITAISWGGIDSDSCSGIYIDAYDRLFVTGGFVDTVDFNPGDEVDNHTSNGGVSDAYLMKLLPTLGW